MNWLTVLEWLTQGIAIIIGTVICFFAVRHGILNWRDDASVSLSSQVSTISGAVIVFSVESVIAAIIIDALAITALYFRRKAVQKGVIADPGPLVLDAAG